MTKITTPMPPATMNPRLLPVSSPPSLPVDCGGGSAVASEGASVGLVVVGLWVGAAIGSEVVGIAVRLEVGIAVGTEVVGAAVGTSVGMEVVGSVIAIGDLVGADDMGGELGTTVGTVQTRSDPVKTLEV